MRKILLVGVAHLLCAPVRAAAPYAEDAAAVAAYFASSVALSATKVAVHDVEGPSIVAGPAAHALRAELLRLGIGVVRPEAGQDFDLRGMIVVEPGRMVWLSSLWRKADGKLEATYDRSLIPPSLQLPPSTISRSTSPIAAPGEAARSAEHRPGRRLRASAGTFVHGRGVSWLAGAQWSSKSRRWETGVEFGNLSDGKTINSFSGNFAPVSGGQIHAHANHKIEYWQVRARISAVMPDFAHVYLTDWLPRNTSLRAGTGLALIHKTQRVKIEYSSTLAPVSYSPANTTYLRPLLDVGLRRPITQRFSLDAGAEWMPTIEGPGNGNFGGLAGTVRVLF